ncbi:hypothetical protein PNOK_0778100 [Pyrrhoderma noxium]|uniref:Uncharacterized protein n=1 Tax=Pyrrhoderma noxium TaxID=2282107 RepID=A0A286U997_9AGAM|nr:hypothetical protein PNOK_0778100 [Pyrrhoderma noxium]
MTLHRLLFNVFFLKPANSSKVSEARMRAIYQSLFVVSEPSASLSHGRSPDHWLLTEGYKSGLFLSTK